MRTIGQIAAMAKQPLHRIRYVLASRGITETGRAGHYRLYDDAAVARIVAACDEIDANKGAR